MYLNTYVTSKMRPTLKMGLLGAEKSFKDHIVSYRGAPALSLSTPGAVLLPLCHPLLWVRLESSSRPLNQGTQTLLGEEALIHFPKQLQRRSIPLQGASPSPESEAPGHCGPGRATSW